MYIHVWVTVVALRKRHKMRRPTRICNLMKDCAEEPYCTLSLARERLPLLSRLGIVKQRSARSADVRSDYCARDHTAL